MNTSELQYFIEKAAKIWQSMLAQSEGKKEIESKLQKILSEVSKR
ncbi:MAG TPA: hypothetical protein VFA69_00255 [Candidatus Nitrosotalea sp.]|nr:hypothetical protein [Candidatus Nitrosotalea sp.]